MKFRTDINYQDRVLHTPSDREGEVEGADHIGTEYETILIKLDNGEGWLHADPKNLVKV